jgi:hypothetical protein
MNAKDEVAKGSNKKEIINVSKLISATGRKVQFQRQRTSVPLAPGEQVRLTASATPNVYYVSLAESSEVTLPIKPNIE